ncbi:MAG: BrnT family toxin [Pseudomonadota bacterium]|nr:BrnT family toxin [Pseudomonadota bacterium]
MRFEWDRKKAERNVRKHGVSFEEAITAFYDPLAVTLKDPDHSIEELRFITFGCSAHDHLLVIAHTDQADGIRIISARMATPRERRKYETQKPRTR